MAGRRAQMGNALGTLACGVPGTRRGTILADARGFANLASETLAGSPGWRPAAGALPSGPFPLAERRVEMANQGSLELLKDPVAAALAASANPARLAYTWTDGSPRVVPIWFHWTGDQFVLATPPKAPKLKALAADPRVALTIDDNTWPHKVLLVRGHASVDLLDDVCPEYELAATRYFGPDQGPAWVSGLRGKPMARIAITPSWVGILDFQTRFPSALAP
jgi:hypothetical protein